MSTGISIHVGLNFVDPEQYGGWDGELRACEYDARDMQEIAQNGGFDTQLLLTADATADRVLGAIRAAGQRLQTGDILLLTYSGHGGQFADTSGDEKDGADETWVLYDREVIDDELYGLWHEFRGGVRIFVLSDSCHSGTVTRVARYHRSYLSRLTARGLLEGPSPRKARAIPMAVQNSHYAEHEDLYKRIEQANPEGRKATIGASILLISGCNDDQLSGDGERNGVFTEQLREVWANGSFQGDYPGFQQAITDGIPKYLKQTPQYARAGVEMPEFEAQRPFTVESPTRTKEELVGGRPRQA